MNYNLISADSHLEIDAKWWRERVPLEYRDQAPRVVRLPDGSDAWLIERKSTGRGRIPQAVSRRLRSEALS